MKNTTRKILLLATVVVFVMTAVMLCACEFLFGHVHKLVHQEAVPANCTNEGRLEHWVCKDCGEIFLDEKGENKCTESSLIVRPNGAHNMVEVPRLEPTCDRDGYEAHQECSICGHSYDITVLPATHTWGEWQVKEDATCTEKGVRVHVCTICGVSDQEETDKLPHTWADGACTVCGTLQGSPGLVFEENYLYAVLVGLGTCTDEDIVIPEYYNDKPVTQIAEYAFGYETPTFKTLTLPKTLQRMGKNLINYPMLKAVYVPDLEMWLNLEMADYRIYGGVGKSSYDLYVNGQLLTELNLSQEISFGLFRGCKSLERLTVNNVNRLPNACFADCQGLTSVTIGGNVEEIREDAFYNCDALVEFLVTGSVGKFEASSVSFCDSLSHVRLGRVGELKGASFRDNKALKKVSIEKVTSFDGEAFSWCDALEAVELLSVTDWCVSNFASPQSNPLSRCGKLYIEGNLVENLLLPSTVKSISAYAFYGCTGIKTVTIPASVTQMGNQCFAGCTALGSVNITDLAAWCRCDFENREANPLYFAQNLYINGQPATHLEIPASVEIVSAYAFANSKNIITCVSGSNQKTFRMGCFENSNLVQITLNNSINLLETGSFTGCSRLYEVVNFTRMTITAGSSSHGGVAQNALHVGGTPQLEITSDGFVFFNTLQNKVITDCDLKYYFGTATDLALPEREISYNISTGVFDNPQEIVSITLSASVKSVSGGAFSGMSSLRQMTLPFVGKEINADAERYPVGYMFGTTQFEGSVGVEQTVVDQDGISDHTYYLPQTLVSVIFTQGRILPYAFMNCALTDVVIQKDVEEVLNNAFRGCSELVSLTVESDQTVVGYSAFADSTNLQYVKAAASTLDSLPAVNADYRLAYLHLSKNKVYYASTNNKATENRVDGARVTLIYSGSTGVYLIMLDEKYITISTEGSSQYNIVTNLTYTDEPQTLFKIGENGIITADVRDSYNHTDRVLLTGYTSVMPGINGVSVNNMSVETIEKNYYPLRIVGREPIVNPSTDFANAVVNKLVGKREWERSVTKITVISGELNKNLLSTYKNVTEVELLEGVTEIPSEAFTGMKKLQKLVVSSSIAAIASDAFDGCEDLQGTIVDGVEYFGNDQNQKAVLWRVVDKSIDDFTFDSQTVLVCARAFQNCIGLTKIVVPSTVKVLEEYAFSGCSNIAEMDLAFVGRSKDAQGVEGIMGYMFGKESFENSEFVFQGEVSMDSFGHPQIQQTEVYYVPTGLAKITVRGNVPAGAFQRFRHLYEVVMVESAKIGAKAFYYCEGITKLTVPQSVVEIGEGAFCGIYQLAEISLPFIGDKLSHSSTDALYPFGYVFGSESFTRCYEVNQSYKTPNGVLSATYYLPQSLEKVTIIGGELPYGAFMNCRTITEFHLPDLPNAVLPYTFYNCLGLSEMTFPEELYAIQDYAFYATALRSLQFAGVTEIGKYAFAKCENLSEIVFSNTLNTIKEGAFSECTSLLEVNLSNANGVEIATRAFAESVNIERVLLASYVRNISSQAFYNCNMTVVFAACSNESSRFWATKWNELPQGSIPVVWSCNSNDKDANGYAYMFVDGIRYSFKDGEAKLDKAHGEFGDLVLSEKLTYRETEYTLTEIGDKAFNHKKVKSVVIPATVKTIGESAFYESGLKSLTFAENAQITAIGSYAFAGTDLVEVTIPGSTERIGFDALSSSGGKLVVFCEATVKPNNWDDDWLSGTAVVVWNSKNNRTDDEGYTYATVDGWRVAIKDGQAKILPQINNGAKTVTIPQTITHNGEVFVVTSIAPLAFHLHTELEQVILPAGLVAIQERAFSDCYALQSVTIPASVVTIGNYAFNKCKALTSVVFAQNAQLETIGDFAFYQTALGEIAIPQSVVTIGRYAFGDNHKMGTVTFAQNGALTTIGEYAFYDCGLTSLTIPASVTQLGAGVFAYNKFQEVTILATVTVLANSIFLQCSELTTVNFDTSSLTEIGERAFNATAITCFDLPVTVQKIGARAFAECDSLATFNIPANSALTTLGEGVFFVCPALTEITIPQGVTEIPTRMFYKCRSLTEVTLPNTIVSIGEKAFSESGIQSYAGSATEFGIEAFSKCTSLTSVVLPEGVIVLSGSMFSGCSALEELTIPQSVTEISESALGGCSSITQLVLPSGLQTIGKKAFCAMGLETITLPEGITEVSEGLFSSCKHLESVTLPSTVTAIGKEAFSYCISLVTVKLPEGLLTIGRQAFYSAFELTEEILVLPDSLTTIEYGAFQNANVRRIVLGTKVTELSQNVFSGAKTHVIFYRGDKAQWQNVTVQSGNRMEYFTFYWYSEDYPYTYTSQTDNFWYYNEGVVTVWRRR